MSITGSENTDQRALRLWFTAGLRIPEVAALYGDGGYLLNNMIAKYTLAADTYAICLLPVPQQVGKDPAPRIV